MRYDTPVYFVQKGEKTYDTSTGNYTAGDLVKTEVMAAVMDTRAEMLTLVYGKIRQGTLTVHTQNHYDQPFDWIEIYNHEKRGAPVRYAVDYSRRLRVKHVFIISETQ